jgi:NNP family nitrate/nitrite transporter-like MFS transporter
MKLDPLRHRLSMVRSFHGRSRVLHLTTFAFFLSFVVWFDMAPFGVAIAKDLHLTKPQMVTLGLCNLALTVPARVLVGALLDRFGPRRLYAALLVLAAVPNTVFALAHSYGVLVVSRLAVGIVGAGFVVGIRMVSEWFGAEELGTAEGIYGGWGNFGSAGAALVLPGVAAFLAGGAGAWRAGVLAAGLVGAAYGAIYWFAVADTPPGATFLRPRRRGALPVATRGATYGLAAMQLPVGGALALVAVRIHDTGALSSTGLRAAYAAIAAYVAWQLYQVLMVNRRVRLRLAPDHDYPFRPVALLSLAYGVTFGAELAVVTLLPTFFATTFGLAIGAAGAAGSAFAFTNLVTRPGGGILSDLAHSRRSVVVAALAGTAVSFVALSFLRSSWPLPLGIGLVALTSVFVQGGNGAVFAMVPQVHRPVSGQIAGLAGSYGNIGGVVFSSVLFFSGGNTRVLFLVVAGAAVVMAVLCRWLPDLVPDTAAAPVSDVALELLLPAVTAGEPEWESVDAAVV